MGESVAFRRGDRLVTDPMRPPMRQMTPAEARSRRARNVGIGLALFAFMALIYAVTLARLSGAMPGAGG